MKNIISFDFDAKEILDWNSFHDFFYNTCGFPNYYGRNMDAWIDCISDLNSNGQFVVINFKNMKQLKTNHSEIFEALIDSASFVNYREIESGGNPFLLVSYE